MQTRDEKMLCISRFFCEAKSHPKYKNKKLTFELLLIIQKNCDKIQKITVI